MVCILRQRVLVGYGWDAKEQLCAVATKSGLLCCLLVVAAMLPFCAMLLVASAAYSVCVAQRKNGRASIFFAS